MGEVAFVCWVTKAPEANSCGGFRKRTCPMLMFVNLLSNPHLLCARQDGTSEIKAVLHSCSIGVVSLLCESAAQGIAPCTLALARGMGHDVSLGHAVLRQINLNP